MASKSTGGLNNLPPIGLGFSLPLFENELKYVKNFKDLDILSEMEFNTKKEKENWCKHYTKMNWNTSKILKTSTAFVAKRYRQTLDK